MNIHREREGGQSQKVSLITTYMHALLKLPSVYREYVFRLIKNFLSLSLPRYSPLMPGQQKDMLFPVEGIHVGADHMCNEEFCTIHLDNLSGETTGAFRCEVSGDAPEFKLTHETSNMTVVGECDGVTFGAVLIGKYLSSLFRLSAPAKRSED
jgi:hypothetical protein